MSEARKIYEQWNTSAEGLPDHANIVLELDAKCDRLRADLAASQAAFERLSANAQADLAKVSADLAAACELLHKLTAIIPGNDGAGKEVAEFLAALNGGGDE